MLKYFEVTEVNHILDEENKIVEIAFYVINEIVKYIKA